MTSQLLPCRRPETEAIRASPAASGTTTTTSNTNTATTTATITSPNTTTTSTTTTTNRTPPPPPGPPPPSVREAACRCAAQFRKNDCMHGKRESPKKSPWGTCIHGCLLRGSGHGEICQTRPESPVIWVQCVVGGDGGGGRGGAGGGGGR